MPSSRRQFARRRCVCLYIAFLSQLVNRRRSHPHDFVAKCTTHPSHVPQGPAAQGARGGALPPHADHGGCPGGHRWALWRRGEAAVSIAAVPWQPVLVPELLVPAVDCLAARLHVACLPACLPLCMQGWRVPFGWGASARWARCAPQPPHCARCWGRRWQTQGWIGMQRPRPRRPARQEARCLGIYLSWF